MIAFLLLGSNIGEREKNIKNALSLIKRLPDTSIVKTSSIHQTEPWGYKNQPYFLNLACKIETGLSPYNLLFQIKGIEKRMGRKKTERYGPRIIDIDILLYGSLVLNEKDLIIPHKELINRKFALICLKEIAGSFIHPIENKTIDKLLLSLENQ